MSRFVIILVVSGLIFSGMAAGAMQQELPQPSGQGAELLLIHGMRPWTGKDCARFLSSAGLLVTCLSSEYLAGLGGSSIKTFLTDEHEPEPKDGITPAFAKLQEYRIVLINSMSENNQAGMFTHERIESMKTYVRQGGILILTIDAPAVLGDLLPVTHSSKINRNREGKTVTRPSGDHFISMPENWPCLSAFREVQLAPGAEQLSAIQDSEGRQISVFLARKTYGQGKVLFLNDSYQRRQGVRQFYTWAYGKVLMLGMIAEAAGLALDIESGFIPVPDPPPRKELSGISLNVQEPQLELLTVSGEAVVSNHPEGREIRLPNGIRILVSPEGELSFWHAGASVPYLKKIKVPVPVSSEQARLESDTAEAVYDLEAPKKAKLTWQLSEVLGGQNAILRFLGSDGSCMDWEFKAGKLQLDGCEFAAVAGRVRLENSQNLFESLLFESSIPTAAGSRGICMSCYAPPRGYKDMDFSGQVNASLQTWNYFGNGQPFTWVTHAEGIYAEFVESPISVMASQKVKAGTPEAVQTSQLLVGRRRAPLQTPYLWYASTHSPENLHNAWLAMYQFLRQHYRRQAGLKEKPANPIANYENLCSPEEVNEVILTAAKLDFRSMNLPLCPTALESLNSEKLLERFAFMRQHGIMPRPWTPSDYCHGDSEKIMVNKDWFIYNKDGELYQYFGKHPVIDLTNPEFQTWYRGILSKMIEAGMGGIYLDMGGQAASNVNYRGEEAGTGLDGLTDVFRFLHQHDIVASVEGMNPLVLDSYWFRQSKYTSFVGKEFALIGAFHTVNPGDDLVLDYFRRAMFGCFNPIALDAYVRDFERLRGEREKIDRIGQLNPLFNKALALTGMPFIRETPFGSSWVGKQGGALFFYDHVEELKLRLPPGWQLLGPDTQLLKIKPETVLFFSKGK